MAYQGASVGKRKDQIFPRREFSFPFEQKVVSRCDPPKIYLDFSYYFIILSELSNNWFFVEKSASDCKYEKTNLSSSDFVYSYCPVKYCAGRD